MIRFAPGYAHNREAAQPNVSPPHDFTSTAFRLFLSTLSLAVFLSLSSSVVAQAVAPDLGSAFNFTVLGANESPTSGTMTCTNTGPGSTIDGDVGTTFTSITNVGCSITGVVDAPVNAQVVTDFENAFAQLNSQNPTCDGTVPTTSTTLTPGVYCSDAGTTIGTGVTFTLDGNATDVWVFRIGTGGSGALTGNGFEVVMGGSADACNVYWSTAESATLTDSFFKGTVLSGQAFTMTRGSFEGRGLATTDATITDAAPIQFAGCASPTTITVNKDFSDANPDPVSVSLTCTSGTVDVSPLDASEAQAAVFSVGGADPGATCTATEVVPAGYSANQTDCVGVVLGDSCTIVNTLIEPGNETITVFKDFSDNNPDPVLVQLSCTSGTVASTPLTAAEGSPAVFLINNPDPGASCTATEVVPAGYSANQTDCIDVALGGSCTIFNASLDTSPLPVPMFSGPAMILLVMLLVIFGLVVIVRQSG